MTAIDLSSMSKEELVALHKATGKAIADFDERKRQEVQASLEALANENGFKLSDFVGGKKAKAASVPKYRHPDDPALTWSGRGRQPQWFKEALEAGKTEDELRIG